MGARDSRTLGDLDLLEDTMLIGADGPLPEIAALAVDSRAVAPGALFAALPGSTVHGIRFAKQAIGQGAAAILTDAVGAADLLTDGTDPPVPVLVASNPRAALARAAASWFGAQPAHVAAVTGTNGKTSVATFLRQIWAGLGHRAVNFGTTGIEGAVTEPLAHTTPEPVELHRRIADLAHRGVTHLAMEASSHGLDQRRLDGVQVEAAAFTNLSRDHLDYHPNFEAYLEAKRGLFDRVLPSSGTAVVVLDDPVSAHFVAAAEARGQRLLTVGAAGGAMLRLLDTRYTGAGQAIRFSFAGTEHHVELALVGAFQALNVLTAAGLAIAMGDAAERVFAQLPNLSTVRGRMEHVATRANGAPLYVDYSHTPGSLATALAALRPHVAGRLIVVFGAGGDRDPGKRVLMGQAAAEGADIAIVTDDNPRSENPASIRSAVLEGCPGAEEIGDREAAIAAGAAMLEPQDLLLIAGKGHETGQTVAGVTHPFDDREAAIAAVAKLDGARP